MLGTRSVAGIRLQQRRERDGEEPPARQQQHDLAHRAQRVQREPPRLGPRAAAEQPPFLQASRHLASHSARAALRGVGRPAAPIACVRPAHRAEPFAPSDGPPTPAPQIDMSRRSWLIGSGSSTLRLMSDLKAVKQNVRPRACRRARGGQPDDLERDRLWAGRHAVGGRHLLDAPERSTTSTRTSRRACASPPRCSTRTSTRTARCARPDPGQRSPIYTVCSILMCDPVAPDRPELREPGEPRGGAPVPVGQEGVRPARAASRGEERRQLEAAARAPEICGRRCTVVRGARAGRVGRGMLVANDEGACAAHDPLRSSSFQPACALHVHTHKNGAAASRVHQRDRRGVRAPRGGRPRSARERTRAGLVERREREAPLRVGHVDGHLEAAQVDRPPLSIAAVHGPPKPPAPPPFGELTRALTPELGRATRGAERGCGTQRKRCLLAELAASVAKASAFAKKPKASQRRRATPTRRPKASRGPPGSRSCAFSRGACPPCVQI